MLYSGEFSFSFFKACAPIASVRSRRDILYSHNGRPRSKHAPRKTNTLSFTVIKFPPNKCTSFTMPPRIAILRACSDGRRSSTGYSDTAIIMHYRSILMLVCEAQTNYYIVPLDYEFFFFVFSPPQFFFPFYVLCICDLSLSPY